MKKLAKLLKSYLVGASDDDFEIRIVKENILKKNVFQDDVTGEVYLILREEDFEEASFVQGRNVIVNLGYYADLESKEL